MQISAFALMIKYMGFGWVALTTRKNMFNAFFAMPHKCELDFYLVASVDLNVRSNVRHTV
jgi:hypothetical protein